MAKKKLSVLSDADEAFLSKQSKKARRDAVTGKPDQIDVQNLTQLFSLYERSNPGKLRRMKQDYDIEHALEKKAGGDNRMLFWMPEDLQQFMEKYYPTIWSKRAHAEWFIKQFPLFKA